MASPREVLAQGGGSRLQLGVWSQPFRYPRQQVASTSRLPTARKVCSADHTTAGHACDILRNLVDPDVPRRLLEPLRSMLWEPAAIFALQRMPEITDQKLARCCHALAA